MSRKKTHKFDWRLVGPWYRWHEPGGKVADFAKGRDSAPIFQKYASSDFVTEFLAEPQKSLTFIDDDHVYNTLGGQAVVTALSGHGYTRTDLRKLFLPMHSRFYLVVCELHCDRPGFPAVSREDVAEAGFVVRKRVLKADTETKIALGKEMGNYKKAQMHLSMAEKLSVPPTGKSGMVKRAMGVAGHGIRRIAVQKKKPELAKALSESRKELVALMEEGNAEYVSRGWVAGETKGFGSWQPVEDIPEKEIVEVTYPLYPLIPDPAEADHSAWKQSIWFGVVPVSSGDMDETGNPVFDDRSLYHARCFVRRYCDCDACGKEKPGPLVWSRPTETYRIAAQQDVLGTGNRPVTIQMPDLPLLSAQTASLPMGEGAGVRMAWPDDSFMKFGPIVDDLPGEAGSGIGGASICFFSIPLITIVATFLLRLFLPIVVFIFGLWFLLKLRFCIPPTFSLDVDLKAAIDFEGGDIEAGLNAEISVNGSFSVGTDSFTDVNDPVFVKMLKDEFGKVRPEMADHIDGSVNDLGNLLLDMDTDFSADFPDGHETGPVPDTDPSAPRLPRLTDKLVYYERVPLPET